MTGQSRRMTIVVLLMCWAAVSLGEGQTGPGEDTIAPVGRVETAVAGTGKPSDPCGTSEQDYALPEMPADTTLPPLQQPVGHYWEPSYHPQVSRRTFYLLAYPYYAHGVAYAREKTEIPLPWREISDPCCPAQAPARETAAGGNSATAGNSAPGGGETGPLAARESGRADPNQQTEPSISPETLDRLRFELEYCCDLIHQWRSVNESPATVLEVARGVALTRTETNIYRYQPRLAVDTKRILEQIGRLNRSFDRTSRMALAKILAGESDRILLSRMEKQLTDLRTILEHLAQNNDRIGIVLGIGRFERGKQETVSLDFADLALPPGDLPEDEGQATQLSASDSSIRR